MLDWAKTAFKKFIEIAKLENYHRRVCDGYLELAITYRRYEQINSYVSRKYISVFLPFSQRGRLGTMPS